MKSYIFIRSIEFNHFFEIFTVSAIATIIVIRFYLQLTGFPQIAAGDLHIAHMLWGGILLLISLLGSLTFLNNDLKSVWAVIGGIGFGTFIDEVGKFTTKDNDYFFQPTFAIIYVFFVLLYVFYKLFVGNKKFSKQEYLINSIEELKEAITDELDADEINTAIKHLSKSDQKNPLTSFLRQTFSDLKKLPHHKPSFYTRMKQKSTNYYLKLISKPNFVHLLSAFFILRTLEYLYRGGDLLYQLSQESLAQIIARVIELKGVLAVLYVSALLLQALFTFIGVWHIRNSRKNAYKFFKYSVLISILILQIFNFYREPLIAFFSTVRDVLLFTMLDYFIDKEKEVQVKSKAMKQ